MRTDLRSSHLRAFPDLDKLYAKFYRVNAKLKHTAQLIDCVKVYNMVETLHQLCTYLEEHASDDKDHTIYTQTVIPLFNTLEEFQSLRQMLEECIDIDSAKQNKYNINPNFSPELNQIQD